MIGLYIFCMLPDVLDRKTSFALALLDGAVVAAELPPPQADNRAPPARLARPAPTSFRRRRREEVADRDNVFPPRMARQVWLGNQQRKLTGASARFSADL